MKGRGRDTMLRVKKKVDMENAVGFRKIVPNVPVIQ